MTDLTTALSTIGERAKAATEGPWMWDDEVPTEYHSPFYKEHAPWLIREAGLNDSIIKGEIAVPNPADATFIAAARTDIPKLLSVIDKLIEQRDMLILVMMRGENARLQKSENNASLLAILTATESKGELKV